VQRLLQAQDGGHAAVHVLGRERGLEGRPGPVGVGAQRRLVGSHGGGGVVGHDHHRVGRVDRPAPQQRGQVVQGQ
jgi:hypothetical protein